MIQETPRPQSHLSLASPGVAHRAPLSGVAAVCYGDRKSGSGQAYGRSFVVCCVAVCLAVTPHQGSSAPPTPPPPRVHTLHPLSPACFSPTLFCLLLGFSSIRVPIRFTCQFTTSFSQGSEAIPEGDVTLVFLFSSMTLINCVYVNL